MVEESRTVRVSLSLAMSWVLRTGRVGCDGRQMWRCHQGDTQGTAAGFLGASGPTRLKNAGLQGE